MQNKAKRRQRVRGELKIAIMNFLEGEPSPRSTREIIDHLARFAPFAFSLESARSCMYRLENAGLVERDATPDQHGNTRWAISANANCPAINLLAHEGDHR